MIPFLLILAAMYWVAAPDPVTASARTAAGTGARAAGAGARSHWASGREQRQARRTKRRDGWWKAGGWRRAALKAEHVGVWSWGAGKTAAGVTAAAVRPVPAAVKAGWGKGRDRHRAKAGNRPAPVALDLPWWHREQPQVQPAEQVQEQPGNSSGDTPEPPTGTGPGTGADLDPAQEQRCEWCDDRPRETKRGKLAVCSTCGEEIDDQIGGARRDYTGPFASEADQLLTTTPTEGGTTATEKWSRWATEDMTPCPTHGRSRFDASGRCAPSCGFGWDAEPLNLIRDNADLVGTPACANCGERLTYDLRRARWRGVPTLDDPAAAWCPDCARNTPATNPTETQGDTVPYTGIDELDNLTSVKDMAKLVADMSEESDFAQLVEFCKNVSDETRDFGSDMAGDVAEFEEIAAKIGDLLAELADAAQKVDARSDELIGG